MRRFAFYWRIFLGLPKTLYLNIHYFSWQGLKLPIIVSWRTRLTAVSGTVTISSPLRFGCVRLGFTSVPLSSFREWNVWNVHGKIVFNGICMLGCGTSIYVGPHGTLSVGHNVNITANSSICANPLVSQRS